MSDTSVKNAADAGQIKKAEKKESFLQKQEVDDILTLLELKQGRRFLWRLMTKAKVFESVWENSARIHYNAGVQDFGHMIMAEIVEAKPEALLQMMQESKEGEL